MVRFDVGGKDDQEIGLRGGIGEAHARVDGVETGRKRARPAHPAHRHSEDFAAFGKLFGDRADAYHDDGLAREQALGPAIPSLLLLVFKHGRKFPGESQHEQERELRHLRSVKAAGSREEYVRRQIWQRQDVIGPGGERLNESQPRHGIDQARENLVGADQQDFAIAAKRHRFGRIVCAVKSKRRKQRPKPLGKQIRISPDDQGLGYHWQKPWPPLRAEKFAGSRALHLLEMQGEAVNLVAGARVDLDFGVVAAKISVPPQLRSVAMRKQVIAFIAGALLLAPTRLPAQGPEVSLAYPNVAFTFAAAYLAEDLGLFAKHGLRLKPLMVAGPGSTNAVIAGSADFALASTTV